MPFRLASLFWFAAVVAAASLLLHLLVFDTWVVPDDDRSFASSTAPQLRQNDRVLILRGFPPSVGQLARCKSDDGHDVVGRVFGVGGARVEVRREAVLVDGRRVETKRACPMVTVTHPVSGTDVRLTCSVEETTALFPYEVLQNTEYPEADVSVDVPEGKMYLVSDNRHLHYDSREVGPVDAASCGHIVFRLWGETFVDASRRLTFLW